MAKHDAGGPPSYPLDRVELMPVDQKEPNPNGLRSLARLILAHLERQGQQPTAEPAQQHEHK